MVAQEGGQPPQRSDDPSLDASAETTRAGEPDQLHLDPRQSPRPAATAARVGLGGGPLGVEPKPESPRSRVETRR